MRLILTSLLFTLSLNQAYAHAHGPQQQQPLQAPLLQAAWTALQNHLQTSEAIVGAHSQIEEQVVKTGIYIATPILNKILYACSPPTTCESIGQTISNEHWSLARSFPLNALESSLSDVATEFQQKFARIENMREVKFWINGPNLEFKISYLNPAGQNASAFIFCHPHAGHIDCHRKSRVGMGEPQL